MGERREIRSKEREAGGDWIKRESRWLEKSDIVQRGEREQMAVENVALKDPDERAVLTDLAVFH